MHDVAPHRLVETASDLSGPWRCICGEIGTDEGYAHLNFWGSTLRARLSDDELEQLLRAEHSIDNDNVPDEYDHAAIALLDDGRWLPLLRKDATVRWTPDNQPRTRIWWMGVRACLFDVATRGIPQLLGPSPHDVDPGWTVEDGIYLHMILCVISRSDTDSWPINLRSVVGLPRARRLLLAELVNQSWLTRHIPGQQDTVGHRREILDTAEASLAVGRPVPLYALRDVPASLRLPFGQRLIAALSDPAT